MEEAKENKESENIEPVEENVADEFPEDPSLNVCISCE